MENYKSTLDTLKYYRDKACEEAKKDCGKCDYGMRYNNHEVWCAFAFVDHFIWNFNRYGTRDKR